MSFDPEKITFFAKTDARGQSVSFGVKAKDRQRHMYIVGKTGMGKSTLLENMAVQDIQNGEGMAFIDPHGSAAETLLDYVPEHRINDVVYFAPFDLDNPISFNVMEDVGQDKRHLVVSGLMSTFKKIWVDAWSARMEYILTNALLVLIEYPDTTLLSVNRIFNDKAYRLKVVDYCTDPAVKSFWVDEYANYTERFAAEALPAIQNKIGQFTGNPLIRNIIGQPHSSFDFREMMDNQKIVIMNLSKGLIGETNANLLGSMLTTRIYLAAMSRANLPVEQMKKMPNFYFYVDEFQSFANATFANILSEARKYHLNLIIAHQYIEQMEEEVRDAVFGNVGTTISFRVGPFDAETLETVFTPRFLAADLVNLGFAQIYLTLMIDGIGSQPFSAVTLPPIAPPKVSCKQMVIAASRRNYTKPREIVEKLVTELHTPEKPEKKTPDQNQKPKTGNYSTGKSYAKPTPLAEPRVEVVEKISATETNPVQAVTNVTPEIVNSKAISPVVAESNQTPVTTPAQTQSSTPAPVVTEVVKPAPKPEPVREMKKVTTYSSENKSRPRNNSLSDRVKSAQTPDKAKSQSSVKVSDLKSVLAKIAESSKETKASDTKKEVPKFERKSDPKRHEPVEVKSESGGTTPLQAALAELKKVDTEKTPRELPPRPFPLSAVFTPISVRERSELEKMADETEQVFAHLEKQTNKEVPLEPKAEKPTHEKAEQHQKSEPAKHTNNPNLSTKHLAKILQGGATEKSPFR